MFITYYRPITATTRSRTDTPQRAHAQTQTDMPQTPEIFRADASPNQSVTLREGGYPNSNSGLVSCLVCCVATRARTHNHNCSMSFKKLRCSFISPEAKRGHLRFTMMFFKSPKRYAAAQNTHTVRTHIVALSTPTPTASLITHIHVSHVSRVRRWRCAAFTLSVFCGVVWQPAAVRWLTCTTS